MTGLRESLPATRTMRCLNCKKQRVCDYGICRPCATQPTPDGESPHGLTGRWVFNPATRVRDYVGSDVA